MSSSLNKHTKVILVSSFKNLGSAGSVVTVKPGYAKNFLVPSGMAVYATAKALSALESNLKNLVAKNAEAEESALKVKDFLSGKSFRFVRNAADDGRLYGSITGKNVCDSVSSELEKNGLFLEISRSSVDLGSGVKSLGIHDASINLHGDVHVDIKIVVCRSEADFDQSRS